MGFSVYPDGIDGVNQLPVTIDNNTPVNAEVTNRLRDAIIAVESELGIQPSGTYSTVRDRLDAIDGTLGSSLISTGASLGSGASVFKQKFENEFQYRSLTAGTNISIVQNANDIVINNTSAASAGSNVGSGDGNIFRDIIGSTFNYKSLVAGTNISIVDGADTVTINSSGESTTADNVGAGNGIFRDKTGTTIHLKTLIAGTGIGISVGADSLTLSTTAQLNTMSNVGVGVGKVYKQKTGSNFELKSIQAGTNISITNQTDNIVINSDAVTSASNTGSDGNVFKVRSGGDLVFKSFTAGNNITITEDSNYITITGFGGINDYANVGDGYHVIRDLVNGILNVKTIVAGDNIEICNCADTITISSTGGGGDGNTIGQNIGGASGSIYSNTASGVIRFRTIEGMNDVSVATDGNIVTINSDLEASNIGIGTGTIYAGKNATIELKTIAVENDISLVNSADTISLNVNILAENVGTGAGQADIFRDKVGSTFNFRRLIEGSGVTLLQSADTVEISSFNLSDGFSVIAGKAPDLYWHADDLTSSGTITSWPARLGPNGVGANSPTVSSEWNGLKTITFGAAGSKVSANDISTAHNGVPELPFTFVTPIILDASSILKEILVFTGPSGAKKYLYVNSSTNNFVYTANTNSVVETTSTIGNSVAVNKNTLAILGITFDGSNIIAKLLTNLGETVLINSASVPAISDGIDFVIDSFYFGSGSIDTDIKSRGIVLWNNHSVTAESLSGLMRHWTHVGASLNVIDDDFSKISGKIPSLYWHAEDLPGSGSIDKWQSRIGPSGSAFGSPVVGTSWDGLKTANFDGASDRFRADDIAEAHSSNPQLKWTLVTPVILDVSAARRNIASFTHTNGNTTKSFNVIATVDSASYFAQNDAGSVFTGDVGGATPVPEGERVILGMTFNGTEVISKVLTATGEILLIDSEAVSAVTGTFTISKFSYGAEDRGTVSSETPMKSRGFVMWNDHSVSTEVLSNLMRHWTKIGAHVNDGYVASGGGGSEFISPLTTKGDLYTFTTADARLAVGTDGQVLKANSATSTGLEWVTESATDHGALTGLADDDHTQYWLTAGRPNFENFYYGSSLSSGQLVIGSTSHATKGPITIWGSAVLVAGAKIQQVGTCTAGTDAANKDYVDGLIGGGGGVTDHGALTGLSDDDHTQYARLSGRSGGQVLVGGTSNGNNLILQSTISGGGDVMLAANSDLTLQNTNIYGSISSGFHLNLHSTKHATKGQVRITGNLNLQSYTVINAASYNGVPLTAAGGGTLFLANDGTYKTAGGGGGGVTDHGALTGLADDDHAQYARLAGRSGGQSLSGGTGASQSLTLQSTTSATKGNIEIIGTLDLNGYSIVQAPSITGSIVPGGDLSLTSTTSGTKGDIDCFSRLDMNGFEIRDIDYSSFDERTAGSSPSLISGSTVLWAAASGQLFYKKDNGEIVGI